ncbi:glycosyltransferase [Vagococcus fluvialis]|uniref:glycosyltransferase n=1 Tax=Vagococcus fluvialis TaxID=2738 RepID=UPI003B58BE0E
MKIRVLFQTRYNYEDRKGGDTIQILKTKEALEKKYKDEIEITIDNNPNADLSCYDLVHVFNLLRPQESILYIENAQKWGKPIALSTIYWKSEEFENHAQIGIRKIINKLVSHKNIEKMRMYYRYFFDGEKHRGTKKVIKNGFEVIQKDIILKSDILLPNGQGEIDLMNQVFDLDIKNYVIIPNAIESDLEPFNILESIENRKDVICVGRIEPRKNQLNLVKALSGKPFEVYLIGKVNKTQKKYYDKVKRNSGSNIHFIDEVTQKELKKYYQSAKVHVLPSWYDTPGLVSLEAGYYGCNLVVGAEGTTKEYFNDMALYVEAWDVKGIEEKVEDALEMSNNTKLSEFISENFTWEMTAKKTMDAYKKIIV